jgi:hypothetical protein
MKPLTRAKGMLMGEADRCRARRMPPKNPSIQLLAFAFIILDMLHLRIIKAHGASLGGR